jgi:hypothetical protein
VENTHKISIVNHVSNRFCMTRLLLQPTHQFRSLSASTNRPAAGRLLQGSRRSSDHHRLLLHCADVSSIPLSRRFICRSRSDQSLQQIRKGHYPNDSNCLYGSSGQFHQPRMSCHRPRPRVISAPISSANPETHRRPASENCHRRGTRGWQNRVAPRQGVQRSPRPR